VPWTPELRLCDALERALAALPLVVSEIGCDIVDVAAPSYPGGTRPSATVVLTGEGCHGRGEHVLWTRRDHERFAEHAAGEVPRGRWRLGEWATEVGRRTPSPHGRAALEAAGIDLALRQAGTNPFRLLGCSPAPVRFVVSFDRRPDPAAEIRRRLARDPGLQFKLDVDPGWMDSVYDELAASGAVAVLDFKGGGTRDDHRRAAETLPDALMEDPDPVARPWPQQVAARVSFDAPLTSAAALDTLPVQPAAVNVKPARMGGVLEALRLIAECGRRGIPVYFGGMFEVSVGRPQLWTLAALLAAEAPNDIAPIAVGAVRVSAPGMPAAPAARERPRLPDRLVVDDGAAGLAPDRTRAGAAMKATGGAARR
jgi:L-alanine-DL-glutamate epimerase-like enolase superfamily enzyme